jgi:glycosyltransferase involved in cell wall biosynthesis
VMASFSPEARSRVRVRPRVTHEEIAELYKDADIFVFPSLSEGFSNALLEAMAAGLPIVATCVGAAPDILEADVSALLIPAGDTDALHGAVRRLLDDAGLREKLSVGARSKAAEYRSEAVLKDYAKLLQRTLISVKG